MKPFSIQTLTALAEVVTGGSGFDQSPSIGLYRSGPKLQRFFGSLNIQLHIGASSRVPAVQSVLDSLNQSADGIAGIVRVIEASADPRDFIDKPEKLEAVVEYLNARLSYDGFQLRKSGNVFRLVATGTNTVAAETLRSRASTLELDSVNRDFDKALADLDRDPDGAIRAACSTVESVCKCILDGMGVEYPASKDIKGLTGEVAKQLNLSPGRKDLPPEWEQDVRAILQSLATCVQGIGALRTKASDAHGRGKAPTRADARIARLAVHAANTISVFYIETWQLHEQKRKSAAEGQL